MHTLCLADIRQHRGLRYQVTDHNEASTPHVECAEECFLHPVRHLAYAARVAAEFVVVKVVDDDVAGVGLTLVQTARRLPAPAGKEMYPVLGNSQCTIHNFTLRQFHIMNYEKCAPRAVYSATVARFLGGNQI